MFPSPRLNKVPCRSADGRRLLGAAPRALRNAEGNPQLQGGGWTAPGVPARSGEPTAAGGGSAPGCTSAAPQAGRRPR